MRYEFCMHCGAKNVLKVKSRDTRCSKCGDLLYDQIMTELLCFVVNEYNEVALWGSECDEAEKCCALSGFSKVGETLEETAKQIIYELWGLTAEESAYIGSYCYDEAEFPTIVMLLRVNKLDLITFCETARWFSLKEALGTVLDDRLKKIVNTAVRKRIWTADEIKRDIMWDEIWNGKCEE